MDRRILTKDELLQLQQFIISRSARFAEPGILLEITDHFASKTEEILTEEKYLSFDLAMKKAHHSFGIKGFAPIAEAYEKGIFNTYKKWCRKQTYHLLFSFHIIGTLLIGLLSGISFLYLNKYKLLPLDGFELVLAMQLIYVIIIYPKRVLYKKDKTFHFFHAKAMEANAAMTLWPWVGIFIMPGFSYFGANATAIMIGIFAFVFSFNMVLFGDLTKKVKDDTEALNQKVQLTT